jgi:hypothetical protein
VIFTRYAGWLGVGLLLLSASSRLTDVGVMALPFYLDSGFTKPKSAPSQYSGVDRDCRAFWWCRWYAWGTTHTADCHAAGIGEQPALFAAFNAPGNMPFRRSSVVKTRQEDFSAPRPWPGYQRWSIVTHRHNILFSSLVTLPGNLSEVCRHGNRYGL